MTPLDLEMIEKAAKAYLDKSRTETPGQRATRILEASGLPAQLDEQTARAEKAEAERLPTYRAGLRGLMAERDALREQLQEARKIIERLVAYNAGAPWPDRRDAQRFLSSSEKP